MPFAFLLFKQFSYTLFSIGVPFNVARTFAGNLVEVILAGIAIANKIELNIVSFVAS